MEVVPFPSPSMSMDGHAAYLSCPTSPSGVGFMGSPQFFYSAPSSPTRGLTAVPFALEAAAAEKAKQGASGSDDFEFEISFELSQRFDGDSVNQEQEDQTQGEEAAPANMAFADELFSNGLVLPLKLPPQIQSPSYGSASHLRSSSSLLLRSGFKEKDDFDPFEAALERVRKEEPEWSPLVGHRRTRSLSPRSSGSFQHWTEHPRIEAPHPIQEPNPLPPTGSSSPVASPEPVTVKPAETKREVGPIETEPKKPLKGKPTRSKSEKVKGISGGAGAGKQRGPNRPVRSSSKRPAKPRAPPAAAAEKEETDKVAVKKWLFRKGSKGRMIKDFLFRSASEGRVDRKDKLRAHTAAIQSSVGPKDMSFGSAHGVLYRGSDEAKKKTTMAYRPSALFECLRMKDQKKKKKNSKVTGELNA